MVGSHFPKYILHRSCYNKGGNFLFNYCKKCGSLRYNLSAFFSLLENLKVFKKNTNKAKCTSYVSEPAGYFGNGSFPSLI